MLRLPRVPRLHRSLPLMVMMALSVLAASPVAQAQPAAESAARARPAKEAKETKPAKQAKPVRQAKPKSKPAQAERKTTGRKSAARAKPPTGQPYADRDDVMRFAAEVAQRQGFDATWTRRILAQAHRLPVVERLTQQPPAGTRKNWAAYRSRFIEPTRIEAGRSFWQAHRSALERAEREFGVPAEIIVGIIGVETLYGQNMGNFRVIDALATLSFDHPPHPRLAERTAFFRSELEQFLGLAHRAGGDPMLPLGSYAGAMGLPQFMPSSSIRWAVDFDGDGRIDLRGSPVDAIGSVANYFKGFGWRTGLPAYYPVAIDPGRTDLDTLLAPDILPTFSPERFMALGATLDPAAQGHTGPLALVELQNGDAPVSYVAGTENFYVVTRYNQSSYYAMAVIELGRAVREAVIAGDSRAQPAR